MILINIHFHGNNRLDKLSKYNFLNNNSPASKGFIVL